MKNKLKAGSCAWFGQWRTVSLLILTVLAIIFFQRYLDLAQLPKFVKRLLTEGYQFAPLLFVLVYALATIAMLPALFMTVLGGAVFGPVLATALTAVAVTSGATIAFLLGRFILRDWLLKRASNVVNNMVDGVNQEGWRFVAFVRLVPLFPFNLSNYAFGITRIKPLVYAMTTFITILPGTFAYTQRDWKCACWTYPF